ncbi:MAG: acylneuraminate cytidylyltransferase family protein [Candidatus Omnitrophica bacterium]|nr:acylneuraminate cytidylyltransferase family protein [Candidatus Omnitrophota bacterium]
MRHQSERVPQKNYRDFNGKPLFYRILETLCQCPSIDAIHINTDSDVVKEKAPVLDPKIHIIDRPKELCGGDISMNKILLYDMTQVDADYFLQTHSTNPLLKSATVEDAINTFLVSKTHDSLFSVTRLQTRLWDADGQAVNHDPGKLQRTQDLTPLYEENSNIYIFSRESLEKKKNRIGDKPLMFEISKYEAMDIDEMDDFQIAEVLKRNGV